MVAMYISFYIARQVFGNGGKLWTDNLARKKKRFSYVSTVSMPDALIFLDNNILKHCPGGQTEHVPT